MKYKQNNDIPNELHEILKPFLYTYRFSYILYKFFLNFYYFKIQSQVNTVKILKQYFPNSSKKNEIFFWNLKTYISLKN